ncbi:putative RNA helicase [Helianthus anomalus]
MISFFIERCIKTLYRADYPNIALNNACCLDNHFCGMVEAWAFGLTSRKIMMVCAMDEGELRVCYKHRLMCYTFIRLCFSSGL